jgi:hypothetical protein
VKEPLDKDHRLDLDRIERGLQEIRTRPFWKYREIQGSGWEKSSLNLYIDISWVLIEVPSIAMTILITYLYISKFILWIGFSLMVGIFIGFVVWAGAAFLFSKLSGDCAMPYHYRIEGDRIHFASKHKDRAFTVRAENIKRIGIYKGTRKVRIHTHKPWGGGDPVFEITSMHPILFRVKKAHLKDVERIAEVLEGQEFGYSSV